MSTTHKSFITPYNMSTTHNKIIYNTFQHKQNALTIYSALSRERNAEITVATTTWLTVIYVSQMTTAMFHLS